MFASQTAVCLGRDAHFAPVQRPIIIVDDNKDDRTLLLRFLESFIPDNTPVITFNSGLELLHYLRSLEAEDDIDPYVFESELPAMIFLDLFMPKMNGVETLKIIRNQMTWADVPVTLVTSSHEDTFIRRAGEAGANSFLPKPFTSLEIIKVMQKAHNFSPSMI